MATSFLVCCSQVSYVVYSVSPPALVPLVLSTFLAEHVTGQLILLILVAPYWMEFPCLSKALNMLKDIPCQCPIIRNLARDASVGWVLKALPSLPLTLWLLRDMYCIDKDSLPQSIRQ